MSERMIELARARMNLPPSKQPLTTVNGGAPSATLASAVAVADPTASAASVMECEDSSLELFLHLLSDQSSTAAGAGEGTEGNDGASTSSCFTTVPSSLSRRVLNTQGVGFLDENVATITSIAADRFLATVLSQSVVCRDRRIKGEDVRKRERKEFKEYRKRRRIEVREKLLEREREEKRRRDANVRLIEATAALTAHQKGPQPGKGKSKKSKKETTASIAAAAAAAQKAVLEVESSGKQQDGSTTNENGGKNAATTISGGDDDDSLSDEDQILSDSSSSEDEDGENDEEEERRYVLHLRDLVRPLEAWGVSLAGKSGLNPPIRATAKKKKKEEKSEQEEDTHPEGQEGDTTAVATNAATSPKEEERSPSRVHPSKRSGATTPINDAGK